MANEYEVRVVGGSTMIGRISKDDPRLTRWFLISQRDLFAVTNAMDIMGVFDRIERPGRVTQLILSDRDIDAVDRKEDDRQEKATD